VNAGAIVVRGIDRALLLAQRQPQNQDKINRKDESKFMGNSRFVHHGVLIFIDDENRNHESQRI
jgi:hypothetical protein